MTLKESIRKRLNEAMGVPDNIVNLSRLLYDNLINSIPEKGLSVFF